MSRQSNGFRVGDIIENGWAGDPNKYSIVVGRTSVRGTPCYKQRMMLDGKLLVHISKMSIYQDRQTKIGHVDYLGYIEREMQKVIEVKS